MINVEEATLGETSKGAERLTVSIALATYNGERFLLEQLESILRQTVLPNELVVSDDGSTDGTLEILESFAGSAPFDVKISSNSQRLGYRKNFLKAAEECRCEIVFFCDQDDIWDAEKISLMRDAFLNPDTVMAYHHVQLIDESADLIGSLYQPFPRSPWEGTYGMSMAFRRGLLVRTDLVSLSIDHNFPEFNLAHDQWVMLLASVFGNVVVVDETLIGYRQHQGNVYGLARPRVSFTNRLGTRIQDLADAFELLVDNCKANAKIFGEISREPDLSTSWREKAEIAEKTFEELGLLYALRSKIYKSPSLGRRLLSFCKFAHQGAYTKAGYWTFGPKGAIRDVIFGVFFSPLVTSLGSPRALWDRDCRRLL